MTTNKPLDLQELRTLAAKASPGPWWIDSHGHSMSDRNHKTVFQAVDLVKPAFRNPETGNLSHWPNDWDASFIAAANPATILTLLDEIEALQAECEQLRKDAEPDVSALVEALDLMVTTHDEGGWPTAAITIARTALAAHRKQVGEK